MWIGRVRKRFRLQKAGCTATESEGDVQDEMTRYYYHNPEQGKSTLETEEECM